VALYFEHMSIHARRLVSSFRIPQISFQDPLTASPSPVLSFSPLKPKPKLNLKSPVEILTKKFEEQVAADVKVIEDGAKVALRKGQTRRANGAEIDNKKRKVDDDENESSNSAGTPPFKRQKETIGLGLNTSGTSWLDPVPSPFKTSPSDFYTQLSPRNQSQLKFRLNDRMLKEESTPKGGTRTTNKLASLKELMGDLKSILED